MTNLTNEGFELYETTQDYTRYKRQTDQSNWFQVFIFPDQSYLLEKCYLITNDSYRAIIIYEGKEIEQCLLGLK